MKRRGARKKAKRTVRRKRVVFFDDRKLLIISIAAFFIFAFLLTALNVSRSNLTGYQVNQEDYLGQGQSWIKAFFTSWTGGNLDVNISKYLFWITILLFINGVLKAVGFPSRTKGGFIRFLLALVVSFLGTAYIAPEEVFVMLTGYSALALTIGSLFPFLIISFTSTMLVSNESVSGLSIGKLVADFALWMVWTGYLIYKFVKLAATEGVMYVINGGGIVFLIILVISVLVTIFHKQWIKWIWGFGRLIRGEKVKTAEEDIKLLDKLRS